MADFSTIIGQDLLKNQLKTAAGNDTPSHAYLLQGEPRSGKEYVAKVFAKALLCESEGEKPCCSCASCKHVDAGTHPDLLYLHTAKPNTIGVDDIREGITGTVSVKPMNNRRKVYIIMEAETMTPQAQNALLKTLEEPPAYVTMLLLTASMEMMLPTIKSRCVQLHMTPVEDGQMAKYLREELEIPSTRAEFCIAFARGNIGRAKSLASSEDFDVIREKALSLLKGIYEMDIADILAAIKQIREYGFDVKDYLDIMAVWYRDVLLFKATGDANHLIFKDELAAITKVAKRSSYEGIEEIIKALEKAKGRLRNNVKYELAMELLLLTIREQ
ncbi:MAG: DNA polymerase III subunit delta' [Lachnospiraceae bacterium]|nr:DNA polymerase III subunit delta' [Lachnospiraceae bacterium]